MHRPSHHGRDGRLGPVEHRPEDRGIHADRDVGPAQDEHENQAGEHESQAGEQTPDATPGAHAEVHAQLAGLGTGKDLVDREDGIELVGRDPVLLVHQLAAEHRDLGDRPAPGQQAEAQEAEEDPEV